MPEELMLKTVVETITSSGKMLKENFLLDKKQVLKSERDFVTALDMESEKIISSGIKDKYPGHNILSEESGHIDNKSDYTWIIDPLCSSNNFVYGLTLYGIAVALAFQKEVVLGAICLPQTDALLTAQKGKGAYLNGNKISVSPRKELKESLILYDNQFYKDERMYSNFLKITKKAFTVRILGSAAFDLSLVAAAKADARIFHKTKVFDFAAGALIIEEAGGKVTNFEGGKWSLDDTAIAASNGRIHEQILDIL